VSAAGVFMSVALEVVVCATAAPGRSRAMKMTAVRKDVAARKRRMMVAIRFIIFLDRLQTRRWMAFD
jgi:hypothetical protein